MIKDTQTGSNHAIGDGAAMAVILVEVRTNISDYNTIKVNVPKTEEWRLGRL